MIKIYVLRYIRTFQLRPVKYVIPLQFIRDVLRHLVESLLHNSASSTG